MIDTDKYEGHLADALICVREGGVDCDFTKIRLEDALEDMTNLLAEVKRLREIEQEWLMMWATLEELNLVADVRKNMTEHGFTFPTDEDVIE